MKKTLFRCTPVVVLEGIRGDLEGLNLYGLRHGETDWSRPVTVEKRFVAVNGYGVLATTYPLDDSLFDENGILDLSDEEATALAEIASPEASADEVRAALAEKPIRFEAISYNLPSFWASAIINGDTSGMEDEEIEGMERWFQNHADELGEGHWTIATDKETGEFVEASFMRHHDATDVIPLASDVLEFIWMKRLDREVTS